MALSTTAIDVNRGTEGVVLPSVLIDKVIQGISENSAVMQLAQSMAIPGSGVTMHVITGDPTPAWTAESTEKPVSKPTFDQKAMQPYKLAVIVPFSDEFRRDEAALYNAIVDRIPNALAKYFDETVLYGTNNPGTNFDDLSAIDAVDISSSTYDNFVGAMTSIAIAGGQASGVVLSPQGNGVIMTARNEQGYLEFPGYSPDSNILGLRTLTRAAAYAEGTPNTLGFIGDWSKAYYGIVNDITINYNDTSTINDGDNQINLWQRNMFALRCEMEVGFIVTDGAYFARLTNSAA